MANFLNSVNPSNFGLNVTGNFNNLASSGTFPLPNTDIIRKLNKAASSSPIDSVQLSDGSGGFTSVEQLYVRNGGLVLDNSDIGSQKPFVLALKTDVNQNYPGGVGSGNSGDVFYGDISGTTTFWGYKGNSWFDLAAGGSGGGAVQVSPPERSLQFANIATNQLSSSSLARFWLAGDTPLPGFTITSNIFTMGNIFQASPPTTSTFFVYSSDTTNKTFVQFDEPTGINFGLNDTAAASGNGEFRVETKETGALALGEDKIILRTWDGNTLIDTFRQTNGSVYGQGSINLLTNTGGITLQSRGENSGGGTTTGVNGGDITLNSQDGNIFLQSIRKTNPNSGIELKSEGAFGSSTDPGIFLNSVQQASGGPSVQSGRIKLQTEGGNIELSTTLGSQGLTSSGSINLLAAAGDIQLQASATARNINLIADGLGGSVRVKSTLNILDAASATTISVSGVSGNITMGPQGTTGDLTLTGPSAQITANGTIKSLQDVISVNDMECGRDLTVDRDAVIGDSNALGNGSLTVKTANTNVGLPALRTYVDAGVDQTQLGAPIVLSSASTTVLNPTSGLLRRFPNVSGAMAYDDTLDMISYTSPDVANPATIVQKYLGNKVLLKTVQCTESLSINNRASNNGPDLANPISYSTGGTSGYQSGDTQRNYDLDGNCFATTIGVAGTAGGTKSLFCLKVQMPPRRPGASAANPEYSVLIEGTCCFSFRNPNANSASINLGFGAYATDQLTPAASLKPGGVPNALTDPWLWGSQLFFTGGQATSYPRPMHASYYKNLADANIPSIDLSNVVAQQFPAGWLDSQKTATYIDWQGSASSIGKAGLPNAGSYFRQRIASGQYEIKQVPFSMLCQNTNDTSTVQTQYIWVTATDAQSSGNFTAVAYRDGYYGFASTVIGNFYGGNTNCSVYYLGDPNLGNITSDDNVPPVPLP